MDLVTWLAIRLPILLASAALTALALGALVSGLALIFDPPKAYTRAGISPWTGLLFHLVATGVFGWLGWKVWNLGLEVLT